MISWGYRVWMAGISWAAATSSAGVSKWYMEGRGSGRFILGNYEGYISEELFRELGKEHGASIDYFDHDYSVMEKFRRGIYDVAVVSTSVLLDMKNKGLLAEVEWSRFGLKDSSNSPINNGEGAKELFTEMVKKLMESESSFLEYGIPYFLNKLSFCYVGEAIESLKDKKVSWSTLIQEIVKEPRFRSEGNRPRLAMIDDPRTVLSLARMVSGKEDVNLSPGDNALETYNNLRERGLNPLTMGKNFLLMSPSSSLMIDSLASGTVNGGFMYNGDCLFASKGGNGGTVPDKFNIVETDKDIYFLDFLVFSKGLKEDKAERIYGFTESLLFGGMGEESKVMEKDEEGEFKHPPMRNFDYVQYTPVLKTALPKIESEYFKEDGDKEEIRRKILKIESVGDGDLSKFYEKPFSSDRQKSDVFIDFEKFKLTL